LRSVPAWLGVLLAAGLALQIAWHLANPFQNADAKTLPPAPPAATLRLASFDEPAAAARLSMLYVQGFDIRQVDYERLAGWLKVALALDPRSAYPLFSAARVYAEVPDERRSRMMLELVHEEFLRDPNRRWPALAHAALLAKHRLKDLPLARRYAAAIDRRTTAPDVPLWAKQMQIFILEDMNELEAARIMLGGLLESGEVNDPNEQRFLRQRLEELEARLHAPRSGPR
jgi:hypothetical protein